MNPINIEAPKIDYQIASPKLFVQNPLRTPRVPNPVADGNPGTTILSSSLSILKNSPKFVRYTRNNVPYDITQFERIAVRITLRTRHNSLLTQLSKALW